MFRKGRSVEQVSLGQDSRNDLTVLAETVQFLCHSALPTRFLMKAPWSAPGFPSCSKKYWERFFNRSGSEPMWAVFSIAKFDHPLATLNKIESGFRLSSNSIFKALMSQWRSSTSLMETMGKLKLQHGIIEPWPLWLWSYGSIDVKKTEFNSRQRKMCRWNLTEHEVESRKRLTLFSLVQGIDICGSNCRIYYVSLCYNELETGQDRTQIQTRSTKRSWTSSMKNDIFLFSA